MAQSLTLGLGAKEKEVGVGDALLEPLPQNLVVPHFPEVSPSAQLCAGAVS